jgi:plasmid stabilization system protein ParE
MTFQVRLQKEANQGLDVAYQEAARHAPDPAARWVARFQVALKSLEHTPERGPPEDRPPTNEPVEPENTDSRNPCQRKTLDKDCGCLSVLDQAERQGFEPWVPLRALRFSRPVRSAALPSLRDGL